MTNSTETIVLYRKDGVWDYGFTNFTDWKPLPSLIDVEEVYVHTFENMPYVLDFKERRAKKIRDILNKANSDKIYQNIDDLFDIQKEVQLI